VSGIRKPLLLIGDLHVHTPDFSKIPYNYHQNLGVIFLGDIHHEFSPLSERYQFQNKLVSELNEIHPSFSINVWGNHDELCNSYEKRYKNAPTKEVFDKLRKLSKKKRKTGEFYILQNLDIDTTDIIYTEDLMSELGIKSNYVFVVDGQAISGVDNFEGYVDLSSSRYDPYFDYELYVTVRQKNHKVALNSIGHNPNSTHILSHHDFRSSFLPEHYSYYHGHNHNGRKKKDHIGVGIYNWVDRRKSWKSSQFFDYYFDDNEFSKPLGVQGKKTPGIYFHITKKPKLARLEVMPGILGEATLLDRDEKTAYYISPKLKNAIKLDLMELFKKTLYVAGLDNSHTLYV